MDWILHFVIIDNLFDLKLLVFSDCTIIIDNNWSNFIEGFKSHWRHSISGFIYFEFDIRFCKEGKDDLFIF